MKTMNGKEELETAYLGERQRLLVWLSSRVNRDEAEDILHDVIVRAFSNLDALEPVRDVVSWLWSCVRNGVVDSWRARRRRKTDAVAADDLDLLVDGRFRSAEDEYERRELIERLYRAMEMLPSDQKEILVAQSFRNETFKSISRRTGVSVETLSARKRRALATLAKTLF